MMRTPKTLAAAIALGLSIASFNLPAATATFDVHTLAGNEPGDGAESSKRLQMTGPFSYRFDGDVATVTLPSIENRDSLNMSAVLRLELWATPVLPGVGGAITGTRLASFATLAPLDPFTSFQGVEQNAPFTAPPAGTYTMVLALLQGGMEGCLSDDGFCVVDSYIAPKLESFGQPRDYSDLWFNPEDIGWGISITQRGSTAFAVVYTYDEMGAPKWYVASNLQRSGESFSGPLYETRSAGAVSVDEVGSLSLAFGGSSSGTLSYTVRGTSSTRPIVRQVF